MTELERLIALLVGLFPHTEGAPKQLSQAQGIQQILGGADIKGVSKATALSQRYLRKWQAEWDFYRWVRRKPPTTESLQRSKAGIAQMMLGFLGEEYFETSARHLLAMGRFSIQDDRSEGSGTDYRLFDPEGRPVCRINVKVHGTLFREAKATVGLDPDDCFPLATYKIHAALERQTSEAVPYLFLIVTVPSLPRSFLESHLSDDHAWLASMTGRIVEEAIARQQLKESWSERLYADIKAAEFRVISTSRAFRLMHEKLFERVFALRVRAFNWTYKGAEVDMHLSLHDEMISFREFVKAIESRGVRETAIRLDRGEI